MLFSCLSKHSVTAESTGQAVSSVQHFSEFCSAELITSQCHRSGAFEWQRFVSHCGPVQSCCLQSVSSIVTGWALTQQIHFERTITRPNTRRIKGKTLRGTVRVHELCLHMIVHFGLWTDCVCAGVPLDVCVCDSRSIVSEHATPRCERWTLQIQKPLLILFV